MKIMCISLVILLVLALGSSVMAKDLINVKAVREKPVNVLEYAEEGARFGIEAALKLLRNSRPIVMFGEETKFGLGTSLVEGFIFKKLDLVYGTVVEEVKDEVKYEGALWGLEYRAGRVQIGAYWSNDRWFGGFSVRWNLGSDVGGNV